MPFPAEHYLMTFSGPLGAAEQWSFGLRTNLAGFGSPTQDEERDVMLAAAAAISPVWVVDTATEQTPMTGAAALKTLKYNRIGVDGRYTRNETNVYDYPTALRPAAIARYPHQISLAATLETGASRGLASKGRIYLPSPPYPMAGTDPVLSAVDTGKAARWVSRLIGALNTVDGLGSVIVASQTRTGSIRTVNRVSVGNVLDTMRSRRGKLIETRSAVELTTNGTGGDF